VCEGEERNPNMRKNRTKDSADVREVSRPDEQWRSELTPLQYNVLRHAHTERPFTGEYVHNHQDGYYSCAGCGSRLFASDAKFESGTGWPSFSEPAVAEAVELRPDSSLFMRRTEVVCRRCGGHLGHVFSDGPAPTGDRYCINSCSLAFEPAADGA
jgi:peptide-methionine (R)-S-oxide reductase